MPRRSAAVIGNAVMSRGSRWARNVTRAGDCISGFGEADTLEFGLTNPLTPPSPPNWGGEGEKGCYSFFRITLPAE